MSTQTHNQPPFWSETRLQFAQELWGRESLWPGNIKHQVSFIRSFTLNPSTNFLDISAGLGGVLRKAVDDYGVWTQGYEWNKELIPVARDISRRFGKERKAPIEWLDINNMELRPNFYNGIFMQFLLYQLGDKNKFLQEVITSLKNRGQFAFIDFVALKPNVQEVFKKLYELRPHIEGNQFGTLWALKDYREFVAQENLDLRVSDNASETYLEKIETAWTRLYAKYNSNLEERPKEFQLMFLNECEYWTNIAHLIKSGSLGVFHFHMIKNMF